MPQGCRSSPTPATPARSPDSGPFTEFAERQMSRRAYSSSAAVMPITWAEGRSTAVVVGSVAGIAVLYELVSLAHRSELATQLHSPMNVWLAAACLFVFGYGLALVAPRVARWFAMF